MTIPLNQQECQLLRHTLRSFLTVATVPKDTATHLRRIYKKLSKSRTQFGRATLERTEATSLALLLARSSASLQKQLNALDASSEQRALLEHLTANYNSVSNVIVTELAKEISHEVVQSPARSDEGTNGSND